MNINKFCQLLEKNTENSEQSIINIIILYFKITFKKRKNVEMLSKHKFRKARKATPMYFHKLNSTSTNVAGTILNLKRFPLLSTVDTRQIREYILP